MRNSVFNSGNSIKSTKKILLTVIEAAANNYVDKNSDSIIFKNEVICIVGTK